jgi:hypothetical protein
LILFTSLNLDVFWQLIYGSRRFAMMTSKLMTCNRLQDR